MKDVSSLQEDVILERDDVKEESNNLNVLYLRNQLSKKQLKFIDGVEDILTNRPEEIGFVCRSMVAASMPHSKILGIQYKRFNNNFILSIVGNVEAGGIPYGTYPRLILSWLSTEVVKTQSRDIILGDSLSAFMKSLGLSVTGGRWGTVTRFKDQLKRLFSAHISFTYQDKVQGKWITANINIADRADIYWNPMAPEYINLFKSKITLGEVFYEEIKKAPIPVDIRAINLLKESSLALDIYFWLTYRLSYLKSPLLLSYENLQSQFGSGYSNTPQGRYEFKRKFLIQLKKVLSVYQDARVNISEDGLFIKPSFSHIVKLNSKKI